MDRDTAITESLDRHEGRVTAAVPPPAPAIASVAEAEAEEPAYIPAQPPPPPTVGQYRLIVNGRPAPLHEPIIVRDGDVLAPVSDVAAAFATSIIDLSNGRYQLVHPDGRTQEIEALVIDRRPTLTTDQIQTYFGARASFDQTNQVLALTTQGQPSFHSTLVEKPPGQFSNEALTTDQWPSGPPEPTPDPDDIPESAKPSVDLQGTTTYTYLHRHAQKPFRSATTSLRGRAYGWTVQEETAHKDINTHIERDYGYVNLIKPDWFIGTFDQFINLYPLRIQSQELSGAKVVKSWQGKHTTSFAAGDIENATNGTLGTTKYLGRLYQVGQALDVAPWMRLKGALLYMENEPDLPEQEGTSAYPRENLVQFAGTEFLLPGGLQLTGHAAHSAAEPDNRRGESVSDWDWRGDLNWRRERANLGFSYEFVGDDYASLGDPASYRDYRGTNLYGTWRPLDSWMLNSNLLFYENNVDGDPSQITTENQVFSLSSSHRVSPRQTLSLGFTDSLSDPRGPDPGSSNRSRIYRVDYFFPFLFDSRILTNYQLFDNRVPAGSDTRSHTFGGSLFKSYGRGSSFYVSPQFTATNNEVAADTDNLNVSVNLNHALTRRSSLYVDSSYNRDQTRGAEALDTVSFAPGVRWQVLKQTALNFQYSINSYNLDRERGWPRNWSTLFFISQGFAIRTPPAFGMVEGWVFEDLNGNGVKDDGEPPVEDAALELGDRRHTTTNAEGRFRFTRVTPGRERVTLDLASLDPAWTTLEETREVTVGRRRTSRVLFPLLKAGSVRGTIFIDGNEDGQFQSTEEPLEQVAVILNPGEQFRRTDADGAYAFEYLLPGEYTLKAHEEDLPAGYEPIAREPMRVVLKAGEDLRLAFPVRLIPVPVTTFPEPTPTDQ